MLAVVAGVLAVLAAALTAGAGWLGVPMVLAAGLLVVVAAVTVTIAIGALVRARRASATSTASAVALALAGLSLVVGVASVVVHLVVGIL